jgi:hypothetical protein
MPTARVILIAAFPSRIDILTAIKDAAVKARANRISDHTLLNAAKILHAKAGLNGRKKQGQALNHS